MTRRKGGKLESSVLVGAGGAYLFSIMQQLHVGASDDCSQGICHCPMQSSRIRGKSCLDQKYQQKHDRSRHMYIGGHLLLFFFFLPFLSFVSFFHVAKILCFPLNMLLKISPDHPIMDETVSPGSPRQQTPTDWNNSSDHRRKKFCSVVRRPSSSTPASFSALRWSWVILR